MKELLGLDPFKEVRPYALFRNIKIIKDRRITLRTWLKKYKQGNLNNKDIKQLICSDNLLESFSLGELEKIHNSYSEVVFQKFEIVMIYDRLFLIPTTYRLQSFGEKVDYDYPIEILSYYKSEDTLEIIFMNRDKLVVRENQLGLGVEFKKG